MEPKTMDFITWLKENDSLIDWQLFDDPWDAMQRRHNQFRDDQIDFILRASGLLEIQAARILDLGCGPGILGRRALLNRANAEYFGVDGDPLMLAAMQHLVPGSNVHPLQIDLRKTGWVLQYQAQFDAVISLTALHWLSQNHLKQLYRAIYSVLKPGGHLVIGDPYLPFEPTEKDQLKAFQDERIALEKGITWDDFWKAFFERYPIKDAYTEYHRSLGYQEPFEGSDDGYPITFYENALTEAGFSSVTTYWKSGLRIVYGGSKGVP
jgi:SAM-dependent methyltransferase